jgi:uncharacterized membrane protein
MKAPPQGYSQEQYLADQLRSTSETGLAFKQALENTLTQIEDAYHSTVLMYKLLFYVGVLVILVAVIQSVIGQASYVTLIFGSFGVANTLSFFLTNPIADLQRSRAELTQLQAAYFHWFISIVNWNGLLLQDGVKGTVEFESLKKVSDETLRLTQRTLEFVANISKKA